MKEHASGAGLPPQSARAVHPGLAPELEVEDGGIEAASVGDRVLGAGRRNHLVAEPAKLPTQRSEDPGLVVDDENTRHDAMSHDREKWANKVASGRHPKKDDLGMITSAGPPRVSW